MQTKLIYFLGRIVSALLVPLVLVYALVRVLRNSAYASTLPERLGFLPAGIGRRGGGAIWVHAVSVGEAIAAETLISRLRRDWTVPIYVSVTTLAGYDVARQRLASLANGVFYAPVDFVRCVRRVLRRLEPSVVVVLETEIWPNLYREVKRAGCGLVVVNGRISDRAARRYAQWRWLFRHVLRWPDEIQVQTETDRERWIAAGADAACVRVTGNLKFEAEPPPYDPQSPVAQWLARGAGSVLIAASTTADAQVDEDAVVLDAWERLDGWRLILAPRKPERFAVVGAMLRSRGHAFWRRSAAFPADQRILLLDTVGELSSLFAAANVVFMGGTLTETGGHNFLEPALAGRPIVIGPRVENFRAIADDFRIHHAFSEIRTGNELAGAIELAARDGDLGRRALERAHANRGTLGRAVESIDRLYRAHLFHRPYTLLSRAVLGPMAVIWRVGSRLKTIRDLRRRKRLHTPVISIGNITTGGTGKTPHVLWLARRFADSGWKPAVLTRGYGRASHHESLALPRGASASVWHTGDEAQIFLRSGIAALGIGADRYQLGKRLERDENPGVFILDDGFSHARLQRDANVVLIDSLNPFGGWAPVPLGRLREPLKALRRATLFVITRCEPGRPLDAIEKALQHYNARAPIFHSRLVPKEWKSVRASDSDSMPSPAAVAFCGLGNPQAFWQSLDALEQPTLDRLTFDDHQQYSPGQLRRIVNHARALGAKALLTTEKDYVNFCEGCDAMFGDLAVYWLRVELEMENEAAFIDLVSGALQKSAPKVNAGKQPFG